MASVEADALTLAQLLTYAALLAVTCEYVEIMKRRQRVRVMVAERAEIEQAGLEGLVRLFLVNDDPDDSRSARRRFPRLGRMQRRHRSKGRRRSVA